MSEESYATCEWKHVNIIEARVCVDHIHMLGGNTKNECFWICRIFKRKNSK